MNITNNTNIANSIASSISKLNLNTTKEAAAAPKEDFKEEDIKLAPTPKKRVDVADIQKYANYMGENLSIDDINYGLMYGRSVIADYCV